MKDPFALFEKKIEEESRPYLRWNDYPDGKVQGVCVSLEEKPDPARSDKKMYTFLFKDVKIKKRDGKVETHDWLRIGGLTTIMSAYNEDLFAIGDLVGLHYTGDKKGKSALPYKIIQCYRLAEGSSVVEESPF